MKYLCKNSLQNSICAHKIILYSSVPQILSEFPLKVDKLPKSRYIVTFTETMVFIFICYSFCICALPIFYAMYHRKSAKTLRQEIHIKQKQSLRLWRRRVQMRWSWLNGALENMVGKFLMIFLSISFRVAWSCQLVRFDAVCYYSCGTVPSKIHPFDCGPWRISPCPGNSLHVLCHAAPPSCLQLRWVASGDKDLNPDFYSRSLSCLLLISIFIPILGIRHNRVKDWKIKLF